jgi:hypothetical protein
MELKWVHNKYFGYDGLDSNGAVMAILEPLSNGYNGSGYWGTSIRTNVSEQEIKYKSIGRYFELKTAKLIAEQELDRTIMELKWVHNKYFGYDGLDSNGAVMAILEPLSNGYNGSGYWGTSIRTNVSEQEIKYKSIGRYFELKTAKLIAEQELDKEFGAV